VATALVSQASLPYVPLGIGLISLPCAALFLTTTIFARNDHAEVAVCISQSLLVSFLYVLIIWALWFAGVLHGNGVGVQDWPSVRAEFSKLALCDRTDFVMPGRITLSDGTVVCLAAVLMWSTPMILGGVVLFLSIFLYVTSLSLRGSGVAATRALRLLATISFVSFIGFYSSATISGAGMSLASAAFAIYATVLISTVIVLGAIIGFQSLTTQVMQHPWVAKLSSLGADTLNFANALAFFFGVVPFVVFILLSFFNQLVRRLDHYATCFQFAKVLEGADARRIRLLTTVANRQLDYVLAWEWTAVLRNVQTIALLLWALSYGATLTYVVLNMAIAWLITVQWGIVSAIFLGLGLVMFLIPVVPGTAVYLTGGVLLVPVCEAAWSGCNPSGACNTTAATANASLGPAAVDCSMQVGGSFWLAVLWACLLTYVLKFIAHICQQKGFGEALGSRVSVRAQVQPNTTAMKAIRLILEKKGVSLGKACIMCGGPDWPTSVLCGILRLSVMQSSLGLTPIFLFTIPTVLAGAFQTKAFAPYSSLDAMALIFLMLMQLLFGLGMLQLTNDTVTKRADELAAIPDDLEVKALDEASAKSSAARRQATKFETLPMWARAVHVGATLLLLGSSYVLLFKPSLLFQAFALTDCMADLGANAPYNFVPAVGASVGGVVALLCLLVAILLKIVFNTWASRATKALLLRVDVADPSPPKEAAAAPPPPSPPPPKADPPGGKADVDSDLKVSDM